MSKKSIDAVLKRATALAMQQGVELVDIAFEKEAPGMYLRAYIDKVGGVGLDDCEKFHMAFKALVEHIDYDFLEVCSPGLDRPIKTLRDAQKAMGQPVELKLYKKREGQKVFHGNLIGFDELGYHLMIGDTEEIFSLKETAVCRRTIDLDELIDELELQTEETEIDENDFIQA